MFGCVVTDINSKECGLLSTDTFKRTILKTCNERNDEWAYLVKGKIEYYMFDLHAFDVIYHHQCYFNFVTKKYIPNEYLVKMDVPLRKPNLKPGRPENVAQRNAFIKVCKFITENEYDQFTLSQLSEKMDEFLINNDESTYNTRYLKIQLKAEFGDKLLFSNSPGQTDITTLKENC